MTYPFPDVDGVIPAATVVIFRNCPNGGPPELLMVQRAIRLGGTCTGEHGIGLHKMGYLVEEAGLGAVDMMRSIKRALDPKNIMNPGKVFTA